MKKLSLIPILGYSLTYPDFSLCYKKFKNYSIIPISKNYSITAKKQKKFVKFDKGYGIYLIKQKNNSYLHFKKTHIGVWLASISKDSIYSGNFAKYQQGDIPAKFSTKTEVGAIMSDIFCNPVGIGVKGGFLTADFIKKFITMKPRQSDNEVLKFIGIILDEKLVITKILPKTWAEKHFIPLNSKVIKIDNKLVHNLKEIQSIVNKKNVTITIKYNGSNFTFKVEK
jgi:hypothetical protein